MPPLRLHRFRCCFTDDLKVRLSFLKPLPAKAKSQVDVAEQLAKVAARVDRVIGRARKVDGGQVVVTGIPIAQRFSESIDAAAVRRRCGLLEWPALLRKLDAIDPSFRD